MPAAVSDEELNAEKKEMSKFLGVEVLVFYNKDRVLNYIKMKGIKMARVKQNSKANHARKVKQMPCREIGSGGWTRTSDQAVNPPQADPLCGLVLLSAILSPCRF